MIDIAYKHYNVMYDIPLHIAHNLAMRRLERNATRKRFHSVAMTALLATKFTKRVKYARNICSPPSGKEDSLVSRRKTLGDMVPAMFRIVGLACGEQLLPADQVVILRRVLRACRRKMKFTKFLARKACRFDRYLSSAGPQVRFELAAAARQSRVLQRVTSILHNKPDLLEDTWETWWSNHGSTLNQIYTSLAPQGLELASLASRGQELASLASQEMDIVHKNPTNPSSNRFKKWLAFRREIFDRRAVQPKKKNKKKRKKKRNKAKPRPAFWPKRSPKIISEIANPSRL